MTCILGLLANVLCELEPNAPLLQCVQTAIKRSTIAGKLLTTLPGNQMLIEERRL